MCLALRALFALRGSYIYIACARAMGGRKNRAQAERITGGKEWSAGRTGAGQHGTGRSLFYLSFGRATIRTKK